MRDVSVYMNGYQVGTLVQPNSGATPFQYWLQMPGALILQPPEEAEEYQAYPGGTSVGDVKKQAWRPAFDV